MKVMTDREKRAAGLLFDYTADPEMGKEHWSCNDLCFEYNNTNNCNYKIIVQYKYKNII